MASARYLLRRCALCLFGTLLLANAAFAQDEEGFSGKAGLGFLATSGNSDSESLNVNLDMWWNYAPWSHSLSGIAIKASASGETTAEAYGASWQTKYALTERSYVFGLLSWDRDEFSAYEQQTRETLGYGRTLIDRTDHLLNAEVGVGARQADLRDGTSQNDSILYLGGDYRWTISETSEFVQTLSVEHGSDNTYIEAMSSLSAKMRDNLALTLSFTVKNNSDVLPGTEKTDTFTAVALTYDF